MLKENVKKSNFYSYELKQETKDFDFVKWSEGSSGSEVVYKPVCRIVSVM